MRQKDNQLIEQYAPILHFHPNEGRFCCYPSDASIIYRQFSHDWSNFDINMVPDNLNSDAPCYYEYWLSEDFIQLRYWIWYNYNRFPGSLFGKGNHLGDWEHIEVRLYPNAEEGPIRIWLVSNHLSARLASESKRYTIADFIPEAPTLTENQIHAWVALGSHAHYPSPKSKPYCYAKLWCDKIGEGISWNTCSNLVPLREMEFYKYTGRWGDEKAPRSPSNEYNNRWRTTKENELKSFVAVPED